MKKLLLLILVLSLSLFALAACGGDDDGDVEHPVGGEGEGDDGTEEVEIPTIILRGITFKDRGYIYDGEPHYVEIRGTLPDDVTVEYENNGQTDAGQYTVTAKYYWKGHYLEGKDDTAQLIINKATYSTYHLRLSDAAFGYDGEPHSLSLKGELPEGLGFSVSGNGKSEKGEYTVTYTFAGDEKNYNAVDPISATLLITDALPAGVSFSEEYVDFDGAVKELTVKGELPAGVSAEYEGNGNRVPGDYSVTVIIDGKRVTQTLHIEKKGKIAMDESSCAGLLFAPFDQGGYKVVGYTGDKTYVVIPDTYLGENVLAVGSDSFKGNTALEYVYLSDTVENVGNAAFLDCTSLAEITVSAGLKTLGQRALENTALRELVLGEKLVSIGFAALRDTEVESLTLPFVGGSSFSSHEFLGFIFGALGYAANADHVPASLKTLILNDACTELPAYSLYGCTSLETVTLGKNVATVGISAMAGCTGLKSVYIPSTVTTVYAAGYDYNGTFFGCSEDLKIYAGAASKPVGYGKFWLCRTESVSYTATFGVTYEQYLAAIGEGEID